jgi:hypothetical protein
LLARFIVAMETPALNSDLRKWGSRLDLVLVVAISLMISYLLLNYSLFKNINCDMYFSGKVSGQNGKIQTSSKNWNVPVAL